MPVLMLSGGQKRLLSLIFGGRGAVCSVCARNTRIVEFTIENLSLWEMREEKQGTAHNQL